MPRALQRQAQPRRVTMAVYKFTEYSTGEPLVSIEYSYDDAAFTMTRRAGSKSETRKITHEECDALNLLSPGDQMRAASIF